MEFTEAEYQKTIEVLIFRIGDLTKRLKAKQEK